MAIAPDLEEALATWQRWQPGLAGPPRKVRRLGGGLTNRSWRVDTDCGQAAVRVNCAYGAALGVDRQREATILDAMTGTGLAPPVWYRDETVLVSGWIEGRLWSAADFADPAQCRRLVALVEIYSAVELALPGFDYLAHLDHYRRLLLQWGVSLPSALEQWLATLRPVIADWQSSFVPALTHHDLTPGNVIEDGTGRLWIIDWEYAALGCPLLDLVGLRPGHGGDLLAALSKLMAEYWQLVKDQAVAGGGC